MNTRIALRYMDEDNDKVIDIDFKFDGSARCLFESYYEFAKAVGFTEGTVEKFMVYPYDME